MKNVTLKIENPDTARLVVDPSNPDIKHLEAIVSFAEASKLPRGNANVRPPSAKRKPFRAMSHTVEYDPRSFHLRNLGITYLTAKAKYDAEAGTITIPGEKEDQLQLWGILNGGHTFAVIKQTIENIEDFKEVTNWTMPLVKIDFIITENHSKIPAIVEGRNTSTQVHESTLDNYNHRYDDLRDALATCGFRDLVAYAENEEKEWKVEEIIQRLACFLRERWIRIQPTSMYKSKGKARRLYTNSETHSEFQPLMGSVLKDVLTLPEFIQAEFSRGHIVNGRKFGRLKSVKPLPKPWVRPGTEYETNHKMDMAVLLPMAAAFRELLEKNKKGEYRWKLPYKAVFRECAAELYEVLVEHTSRARLGSHVSSDMDYWGSCLHTVMRTKERMIDRGIRPPKEITGERPGANYDETSTILKTASDGDGPSD